MRLMRRYREDPGALSKLVADDRVHRDVYIDPEVFQLEMERLWSRTWIYVGHTSQVPQPGDFITVDIAAKPVILVRHTDGKVRVLMNRCAHKGTKVVYDIAGNTGKTFRCPYHAWTYRTDGTLLNIPLKTGYEGTRLHETEATRGLTPITHETYRGFVFARLADGPGFREYFGDSLSSIDNLADRSPEGELEIVGGCLRYLHNCNWKMFVENLNDTMHPMIVHASSAGTAKKLWEGKPADEPEADGDRAVRAVRQRLQVLRRHGRARVSARPRLLRREFLDPFLVLLHSGIRGGDETDLRRGAREADPRHRAPQHRVLPEPHHQRRDPVDPGRSAAWPPTRR